jgi:hypothetical protein
MEYASARGREILDHLVIGIYSNVAAVCTPCRGVSYSSRLPTTAPHGLVQKVWLVRSLNGRPSGSKIKR